MNHWRIADLELAHLQAFGFPAHGQKPPRPSSLTAFVENLREEKPCDQERAAPRREDNGQRALTK
jgi:hypothetical protein